MHHHNDWYGQVRILARYAGTWSHGPSPRLWGYLQHGWNVHDGFGARTPIAAGMPRLVWSDRPRRRGWALDRTRYEIIGAPWLYLLRMEPDCGLPPPNERAGTIFYPFHAFDKQAVTGDHRVLADEIRDTESGAVTVCLYWLEFRKAKIRRLYEARGFRVISHGYRGDRQHPGPIDFLGNQLTELRQHHRVASNRLSTAILYGASVGCEVGVYGDPMAIEDDHPVYGGLDRIRDLWPEMHDVRVPRPIAAAFAAEELGLKHIVSPTELAEICGWAGRPYEVGNDPIAA
jgi:hypothetical protein